MSRGEPILAVCNIVVMQIWIVTDRWVWNIAEMSYCRGILRLSGWYDDRNRMGNNSIETD
jgi:hypothetical protein